MAAHPADHPGPFALVADLDAPDLEPDDAHHLARVLRLRAGDPLVLGDGAGRWLPARFGDPLEATGPVESAPRAKPEITVAFALVKGDKPELTKVLSAERIVAWQKLVKKIEVPKFVNDFIVKLVRATRPKDPTAPDMIKRLVDWGAGPRAGIFLAQGGQAFAAMDGRPSVAIDDIKKAAVPVLRHRVSANFQAQAEGKTSDDIVAELLKIIAAPEPKKYKG